MLDPHQSPAPYQVFATAGLRLLAEESTAQIVHALQTLLPTHTSFVMDASHVQLISGETEGFHSWVALNYIEGRLTAAAAADPHLTVGSLDMGGGSAQITFQVFASTQMSWSQINLKIRQVLPGDVRSEVVVAATVVDLTPSAWPANQPPLRFHVYTQTLLGFGANEARARYVQSLLRPLSPAMPTENASVSHTAVSDPCLPVAMDNAWEAELPEYQPLQGAGDYAACRAALAAMIRGPFPDSAASERSSQANFVPGKAQPPMHMAWIGLSEYFYTHYDVFGLQGRYDAALFDAVASTWCARNAAELLHEYAAGRYPHAKVGWAAWWPYYTWG